MPQRIPDMLGVRLWRLAARIALGHRSDSVTESTALACDLIAADVATPQWSLWRACPVTRLGVMQALRSCRCLKASEPRYLKTKMSPQHGLSYCAGSGSAICRWATSTAVPDQAARIR